MDRKRLGTLLCGAVFCMMAALVQLTPAWAAELADPAQKVSLTIEAQQNGRAVSGMGLSLRRVAEMDARGRFALMGSYQSSGVSVDGLTSSSQWNQAAKELNDFAAEESIPADVWTVTEGQGVCTIDGLESGLYLVAAEMLAATAGLGYMIQQGRNFIRSDIIIVGMLTIGLTGALMSFGLSRLEGKLTPWRTEK